MARSSERRSTPQRKCSNNPQHNAPFASTPSASTYPSSPPPYSVYPPQYSPARDERTPLLPSYGNSRNHSAPERKKRITLTWLALLVTALVLTVLVIFAIIKPALEHADWPPPPPYQELAPPPINCSLAIIGAGPSGIAIAYTLARKLARSRLNLNLSITVIEQGRIGGRMIPTQIEGVPERTPFGDSLLSLIGPEEVASPHLLNRSALLQNHARNTFGLPEFFEIESRVGIHDGKTLLDDMLRPSKNTPWMSWLGLIFKYGASVWRAPNVPDKTTKKLNHISSLDKSYPFRTTEALVNTLGLSSEVSSTGAQLLRSAGISSSYEASVILPETEKRFKQRPEHITNLALSMVLQEADKGSRFAGGKILPVLHDMLDASGAQLSLSTRVTAIRRLELAPKKFQWLLQTQGPHVEEYRAVDKVVFAAPWKSEELEIDLGSGQKPSPPTVQYTDDHITFYTSRSELIIDRLGKSESGPRRLLMSAAILQQALQGIREIAFIKDIVRVENHELVTDHLYRVSSNQPLSNSTLDYLLGATGMVTWKHENYIENAYPLLLPGASSSMFELHDSFWHTGGIEAIGSSLDLSLAAGMNVASLVMETLRDLCRTLESSGCQMMEVINNCSQTIS